MANAQKYTRGQIGGLTRHYERTQKEDGTYYDFGNQDIDISRTHLNYNLAPERDGGQLSFISKRTSEVQCLNRADVNVMCSWVITVPKDLKEDEHERFFRESYDFLNQRYAGGSDKNVISAYVHVDEVSPHLHYAFVPVVHDAKKGIDKVSAKIAIDRLDLQTFHQDLEKHMAGVFGREIGIINEATKDGNKSIDELKRGTAQATLKEIQQQVRNERDVLADTLAGQTESEIIASELRNEINTLEDKKIALTDDLDAINGKLDKLSPKTRTLESIEKISTTIKKPILGGSETVTVSKKDWDDIIAIAIKGARTVGQEQSNIKKAKTLDEREKNLDTRQIQLDRRESRINDSETGLEAQRKRADHWVTQADTYKYNYNRVLKELNQLKGLEKNKSRER